MKNIIASFFKQTPALFGKKVTSAALKIQKSAFSLVIKNEKILRGESIVPHTVSIFSTKQTTSKSMKKKFDEFLSNAFSLIEKNKILEARESFDELITILNRNLPSSTLKNKLLSKAHTGRGIAYMTGSALHGEKALDAFNQAISLDPSNHLASEKKEELEFELGITTSTLMSDTRS